MIQTILLTLYVRDVATSAGFYAALFETDPAHQSENYAQFLLGDTFRLGLWQQDDVEPAHQGEGCRSEIDFPVATRSEVAAMLTRWQAIGVHILESPVTRHFGFGFVARDPDGHRLRVLAPPM